MDVAQDADRDQGTRDDSNGSVLLIPWLKPPSKKFREILLPPSVSRQEVRPIKAERRAALIKSIARGRAWLDEIVSGAAGGRADRRAPQMQRSSRQHDDLTGLHRSGPGQGRPRGPPAPRHWRRQLARCAGPMVAPVERLGLAQWPPKPPLGIDAPTSEHLEPPGRSYPQGSAVVPLQTPWLKARIENRASRNGIS